jgi:hypothetical protein
MKQEVAIGQQDYSVLVLIRDSTTGAPKTALTYASAGIDVCYTRVETDNDVVLADGAPVETTLTGAHVDWGFVKVDDTKAPGLYKLDIADGVFLTGAWSAVVSLICTGCDPIHLEFVLVPKSPYAGVLADVDTIKTQTVTCAAGVTVLASVGTASASTAQTADVGTRVPNVALITGAVATDGANSATSFKTNLASAVNDFYEDMLLVLTSGALSGQVKRVTAYVGASNIITVAGGFTGTPADGVTFALINS